MQNKLSHVCHAMSRVQRRRPSLDISGQVERKTILKLGKHTAKSAPTPGHSALVWTGKENEWQKKDNEENGEEMFAF